ncbi:NrdG Organic radical activating enzymes [uncultured Caudovirales phage]|uniref:NrdG Organic radical activating enzymes n=1 Tax=uncultured Caudovirales phage TaxID=2100421 RepID=A0A6J5PC23_9CAUD|nr:NrdG Organic radical activating enzymes [uncultured Caudovirales phage]CAB5226736.1 NrdG Organic radical activating enzymes [uncultured Caudovirales phage]
MKNLQKSEHRLDSAKLELHSIFKTIQGEGPFSGTPCTFIRLAGCNLQCPNCDTDYTSKRVSVTPEFILSILKTIRKDGLVVITGGEPFRQYLSSLIGLLTKSGYYVQIETNGTIVPSDIFWSKNTSARSGAYLVCSPKTQSINEHIEVEACAFKYVLNHKYYDVTDGLPNSVLGFPTKLKVARPSKAFTGLIYLQPEDSYDIEENVKNKEAVVKSCLQHDYILNLQIHKLIGVE